MTDLIVDHTPRRRKWTDEALHQEVLKYRTKRDFMRGSDVAYQTIQKAGRIDEFCAHMKPVRIQWTDDLLRTEALKFSTRTEFARKSKTAYNIAQRRGLLDEICDHMGEAFGVDAVYLWKVRGTDLYKIGITASIYGLCRMYQVAQAGGFDPEIVIQTTVKCRPHQVERQVLSLGLAVTFDHKFQGYTEFRRLNDNEVAQAVGIIASNSWLN